MNNVARVAVASDTLRHFHDTVGSQEDPQTDLVDLLADLMHLAYNIEGYAFDSALDRAYEHFNNENKED